jgi:alanine racemase
MENFTLSQIATVTGGKLVIPDGIQHHKISQIVTDSRTFFKRGETLFFALTGPRNHGHDYIPELIKKGLSAFVVSETAALRNDAIFIVVNNTLAALQKLAAFNRKQYHYPVVGITGSNGKTIVKEWLHDLLAGELNIVRNPKSYNSQTGVPLSVLLMTEKYNLAIFEAGISQPGEMEKLSEIINPDFGILTNIGDAHQENFNTLREKIQEKLLLFRNSKKLVYCVDAEELKTETEQFCTENSIQKISWSLKGNELLSHFLP